MNKNLFEIAKQSVQGRVVNLTTIPGFITWTWNVTGTGTNTWPKADQDHAYDGDRATKNEVGYRVDSGSSDCDSSIIATFPTTLDLTRIYAKGAASCEESGQSQTRTMYVNVNASNILTQSLSQTTPYEFDDSTSRTGVTSVIFRIYAASSHNDNSAWGICYHYELELYGRI
jgi:hypothetical protein